MNQWMILPGDISLTLGKNIFSINKMKLELPQIGLGTCFGSPEEMKQATTWAIDIGYSWDLRYIGTLFNGSPSKTQP